MDVEKQSDIEITIRARNHDEKWKIANALHEQLMGNEDYIVNAIVLCAATVENVDDRTLTLVIGHEAKPIDLNLHIEP